jgi:hypothetical protein
VLSDVIYTAFLSRLYQRNLYKKAVRFNIQKEDLKEKKDSLDSGKISHVIKGVKMYGMCRPEVINEAVNKFSKDKKISTVLFYSVALNLFRHFPKTLQEIKDDIKIWNKFKERWQSSPEFNELFNKRTYEKVKKIFKDEEYDLIIDLKNHPDIEKFQKALMPYIKKNDLIGFFEEVFKDCLKKESVRIDNKSRRVGSNIIRLINLPELEIHNKDTYQTNHQKQKAFHQIITSHLNKKDSTWMSLIVCSQILEDKRYVEKASSGNIPKDCKLHGVIIAGKRAREGSCQYLIRNSWGDTCNGPWECLKGENNKALGIWVDSKSILPVSENIFHWKSP